MYPLKFKKHLVKKIWGGNLFETSLSITLPSDDLYGESWEVSSHKNGMSFVENGDFENRSLQELLSTYKEELVGKSIYEKYNNNFPLLIKYLDINDKLSVQVHPSDEYALRVEGEFGKSETWYIIEASDDAELIIGTKPGINKDNFLQKFENKEFQSLFNVVKVKKGDFINVAPGTVHATLNGSILICETQQNSDTTYRIYDFDRLVDGALRPLHLEKAVEVIDFHQAPQITSLETRKKIELKDCIKEELIRGEYFNIDRLLINGEYSDEINCNFKTYSILDGTGNIIFNNTEYSAKKGDTYFIPALLEVKLVGNIEILKSYL